MAHDRSKSEMTVTTCISRTELNGREEKSSVHNERRPHARSAKVIKRSVPAYASDLEMMRVAAQLSGLGRDDQATRTEHQRHRASSTNQATAAAVHDLIHDADQPLPASQAVLKTGCASPCWWIGGIKKLEEFDELPAAVAISDEGNQPYRCSRISVSASDFAERLVHLFRPACQFFRDLSQVSYCLLPFPGMALSAHRRDVARRPARVFLPGYRGCRYQARDSCLGLGRSLTSGAYCRAHLD
jgi:hypothetical protein